MVCYLYDCNTFIIRPMASHTDAFMVKAFEEVIEYFDSKGCTPRLNVMDNTCHNAVKAYITSQDIDIQLGEKSFPHSWENKLVVSLINSKSETVIAGTTVTATAAATMTASVANENYTAKLEAEVHCNTQYPFDGRKERTVDDGKDICLVSIV